LASALTLFAAFFACFSFTAAVVHAQDDLPTATVLVAKLNVRSGPGTNYARLGQVSAKDVLEVVGQAQNCGWLKVQTEDLAGWVSGQRQYIKLSTACSNIPAATVAAQPAAPASGAITATVTATVTVTATDAATTTVTPVETPAPVPTAAPTEAPTAIPTEVPTKAATEVPTEVPTPEATAAAEEPVEDPLPGNMGCFLMNNTVGPELNVTTTNKESGESGNFKVPAGGAIVWCMEPGFYAFTIDAPPPWDDLNTDRKISAGERFEWTIGGRE
jgi:uncharacterized protein YgiM (DUF1202 family)